jgi:tRNA A-37 threonylcarbamoyl transferase component Bud32
MKRARSDKNCQVTKGCFIQCEEESNKWVFVDETPEDLKEEQQRCKESHSKQRSKNVTTNCVTPPFIQQQIRNTNVVIDVLKSTMQEPHIAILSILGIGSFGMVISICSNKYQYAVKMETNFNEEFDFAHEFKMQTLFSNVHLAPVPLYFIPETFKYPSMIIMNELDGILVNWLKQSRTIDELDYVMREIIRILVTLTNNNLMHRDLHFGNIGYITNQKNFDLVLIDFGLAQMGSNLEIELVSLILSCFRNANETHNFGYLKNALIEIYTKNISESIEEPLEFWELKKSELLQETKPIACEKMTMNGVVCTGKLINFKIGEECLIFCKEHTQKVLHEFIFFMLNNTIWIDTTPLKKPIIFLFDSHGKRTTIEQRTNYSL